MDYGARPVSRGCGRPGLITESERLRRWQTVAARGDLRVGGDYRWTITPGHSAAGTFTEIEPGKRIVFTWGWEGQDDSTGSTLAITLEPVAGGTTVRLVHEGLSGESAAGHTEGWIHYLGRLEALATAGDAGADDRAAAPDPINELISAEATLAIVQRILATLTEAHLALPTPCDDFSVAALVEHLVGSISGIGQALGVVITDDAGASPEVRVANTAALTLEALATRGLEGTIDMGFAELPATTVANILNLEFLVEESAESLERLVAFTGRQTASAGNPDNAPRWYQNIDTAEWLSEPPLCTGSQVRFSARFLNRTLIYTWDEDGAGPRMTLRNAGQPRGFSILAGVFMSPMMRRAMRKNLAKLKDILEPPASGT